MQINQVVAIAPGQRIHRLHTNNWRDIIGKGVTAVEIDVAEVDWRSLVVAVVGCVVKDWEASRQYVGIIGVILGIFHKEPVLHSSLGEKTPYPNKKSTRIPGARAFLYKELNRKAAKQGAWKVRLLWRHQPGVSKIC